MSDPVRMTSHDDKTFGRNTQGLILRIIVVACLGVLFWHTVIAPEGRDGRDVFD
jgi:hypothetical protein